MANEIVFQVKDNLSFTEYFNYISTYADYYNRRYEKYKKYYSIGRNITIIAMSIIPVATLFTKSFTASFVIALASVISGGIQLYLNSNQVFHKYLTYRKTCDKLRSEQRFYCLKVGKYDTEEETGKLFVQSCEDIIAEEENSWYSHMEQGGAKLNEIEGGITLKKIE